MTDFIVKAIIFSMLPRWARTSLSVALGIFGIFFFLLMWRVGVLGVFGGLFASMTHSVVVILGYLFQLAIYAVTGHCPNPHGCMGS